MTGDPVTTLEAALVAAGDSGRAWLDAALEAVAADPGAIARRFPAASRKLGRAPLYRDEAPSLPTPHGPLPLAPWCRDDAGRALLLLACGAEGRARAAALYHHGELRERIGSLRCLALLSGDDDAALAAVEDALRTNTVSLFEAVLCENPYTAERISPLLYNQSVLKAAFMGVRLHRILRLAERASPELSRMLTSYVSERTAAGRSVPFDVWDVIAHHPLDSTWGYLEAHASDPFPGHRFHVARALRILADGPLATEARGLLEARRKEETHPRVRELLAQALPEGD